MKLTVGIVNFAAILPQHHGEICFQLQNVVLWCKSEKMTLQNAYITEGGPGPQNWFGGWSTELKYWRIVFTTKTKHNILASCRPAYSALLSDFGDIPRAERGPYEVPLVVNGGHRGTYGATL